VSSGFSISIFDARKNFQESRVATALMLRLMFVARIAFGFLLSLIKANKIPRKVKQTKKKHQLHSLK
jgi:hypothetical protein